MIVSPLARTTFSLLLCYVQCFTSTSTLSDQRIATATAQMYKKSQDNDARTRRKPMCIRCPDDVEDDADMARRETFFAVVGMAAAVTGFPTPAAAVYGVDAKIEVPNPAQAIADRQNGQCLVETLGNRECLVYLDPANKLYQGADSAVLLGRVEKASEALATIPTLVEAKKWSQVTGVLTGPLGTLISTMNQLTKISGNADQATALATKIKLDIFAIGASTERKQGDKILAAHQQATQDLVAFVKAL